MTPKKDGIYWAQRFDQSISTVLSQYELELLARLFDKAIENAESEEREARRLESVR